MSDRPPYSSNMAQQRVASGAVVVSILGLREALHSKALRSCSGIIPEKLVLKVSFRPGIMLICAVGVFRPTMDVFQVY